MTTPAVIKAGVHATRAVFKARHNSVVNLFPQLIAYAFASRMAVITHVLTDLKFRINRKECCSAFSVVATEV